MVFIDHTLIKKIIYPVSYFFQNKYKIKDLYGWITGQKGGLLALANSLDIKMKRKGLLYDLKPIMIETVKQLPETFVDYCFGDVEILEKLYWKKIKTHNQLLKEVFNLSPRSLLWESHFTMSTSSLVNKSFINVIMDHAEKEGCFEEFISPSYKLGVLNTGTKNYKSNLVKFRMMVSNIDYTLKEMINDVKGSFKSSFFNYDVFEFDVFNSASIPFFLTCDTKNNNLLNSIVTGALFQMKDSNHMF